MTALLEGSSAADDVRPLTHALAVVRHRTGRDVLLEADDGGLVDYCVATSASGVVVRAVLSKDLSPLRSGAARQRALGVVPGGAVVARQLDQHLVAVVAPGRTPGARAWLWLLGPTADVALSTVQDVAALVAAHVPDAHTGCGVEALVSGRAPLPPGWHGHALTVAAVRSDSAHEVLGALRSAARAHDVPAVVGVVDDGVVAVCLGTDDTWLRSAAEDLHRVEPAARGAWCSATEQTGGVPGLHAMARAAAAVSDSPLQCGGGLASRVAVQHAADAVACAPVERDVTAGLLRHDAQRGTDVAGTLLAWLDLHGDVPAAARLLTVHVNTLRYRLRRAEELLGCDLTDAAVRLDVHLRLRRALRSAHSRRPARA